MLKPRILCRSTLFSVLGALVVFAHTVPVWAGGGVKATIADKPEDFGVETRSGPGGVALRVGRDGNVFVAAKDIKITSALAKAIAKRYLQKKYKFSCGLSERVLIDARHNLIYLHLASEKGDTSSVVKKVIS